MAIKIIISSAIVSAVISVIGNIISAKISQNTAVKTARETASSEVDKMTRTWNHDDVVSSADEFAEMAATVAQYISSGRGSLQTEALGKVASIRSKEILPIGCVLDRLYTAILTADLLSADHLLTEAIKMKRAYNETHK